MRPLGFSLAALALLPTLAFAQSSGSVFLRWDACYGDGGVDNHVFACNTNAGVERLVVSAVPAVDVPQVTGAWISVIVASISSQPPSWWELTQTGCRSSSFGASVSPDPSWSHCGNAWQTSVGAGYDYLGWGLDNGSIGGRARLYCAQTGSSRLTAGQEFFLASILINHAKTTGTGTCSGCSTGMCFGIVSIQLTQPAGVGDVYLNRPAPGTTSDVVTWQSGAVPVVQYGPDRCPSDLDCKHFWCTSVVDAARPTWGAIKSLYR